MAWSRKHVITIESEECNGAVTMRGHLQCQPEGWQRGLVMTHGHATPAQQPSTPAPGPGCATGTCMYQRMNQGARDRKRATPSNSSEPQHGKSHDEQEQQVADPGVECL